MPVFNRVLVTPMAQRSYFSYRYAYDNPYPGLVGVSIDPLTSQNVKKTEGVSISDYHRKVKAGVLLPHTDFLQSEVVEWNMQPYNTSVFLKSNPTKWWKIEGYRQPLVLDPVFPSSPDLSGASAEIQRAASNIMSKGFDALTFTSELGKTRNMMRDLNRTVAKILRDKRNLPRNISRAWLEGRYGWSQVAREASSLQDAVMNFDSKRRIWSERSGYSYSQSENGSKTHYSGSTIWGYFNSEWVRTTSFSIRGSVTADVTPSKFRLSPVATAWELIPLSFVLDWALQVGHALDAISLVLASNGVSASKGFRAECNYSETVVSNTGSSLYDRSLTGGKVTSTVVVESREPAAVPLSPQLSQRIVRPAQVLDLTAIARARSWL